MTVVYMTPRL